MAKGSAKNYKKTKTIPVVTPKDNQKVPPNSKTSNTKKGKC